MVSYSAWRFPALWIPAYAGMTVMGCGNDGEGCWEWRYEVDVCAQRGVARPLPLWIADQVRNDVDVVGSPCPVDFRLRGNDGEGCWEWRYGVGAQRGVSPSCGLRVKFSMTAASFRFPLSRE